MWVRIVRENFGRKIIGQFHDEIITLTSPDDRESCKNDLEKAISMVNRKLKLNRELEIDVQFGDSYADIH
jgi:DNA polymerase I-like protein with 3'-5' exonuclease and polymerase domains